MSFDDYLWIRGLSLVIEVMHNSRPLHEFFHYASVYGISLFDFIKRVYGSLHRAPRASAPSSMASYLRREANCGRARRSSSPTTAKMRTTPSSSTGRSVGT
jgi:hypothetical protein